MSLTNRELFQRDPISSQLLNDGQARITDGLTEQEWNTLREELSHFVCEGQYEDGMVRILTSFLRNVGGNAQSAAWVSGFYGSGKSHLLKMLGHLWVNTTFPGDGVKARDLVVELPTEVKALLTELDTEARRQKCGTHMVMTTLPSGGGNESVRLNVLGAIFRSKGLPTKYECARFCLYLMRYGWYDQVVKAVEQKGKSFSSEVNNLYVSPVLREAVLACDPDLGKGDSYQQLLRNQFGRVNDVSTDEFIGAMREVLEVDGKLPLTILVLDEVQLFIGQDEQRAAAVTELAEAINKQTGGRVQLVGAGQNALSSDTPHFRKLKDRFTIPVELSDADVEVVTRKVLLQKRPEQVEGLKKVLDKYSGEIQRQLQGTHFGPRVEDQNVLVSDYPLLPARRRFFEQVLHAIDASGASGNLRTQLRIVHEALREHAEKPVGTVVPGDVVFHQQRGAMVQQGVLLRELDDRLSAVHKEHGLLPYRLCALIFLIRKLQAFTAGMERGAKCNERTLIDLLVSDLDQDRMILEQQVPDWLNKLVEEGVLLKDGDEYNLQTREAQEWEKEYKARSSRVRNDAPSIEQRRVDLLRAAVERRTKHLKLRQGSSNVPRDLKVVYGDTPPENNGTHVPVWVQDQWSTTGKNVETLARTEGTNSPMAFVFVQKNSNPEQLKELIIRELAARDTLDHMGGRSGEGSDEARRGMETRQREATAQLERIIDDVVQNAKVFMAGGSEISQLELKERLDEAGKMAMVRLFPRFKEADHKNWSAVQERAKKGDDAPLRAVEWEQATNEHPVCKTVLKTIGSGATGREVHKVLEAAPYGWSADAIDGALMALHAVGDLKVTYNAQPLAHGQLDQNKVPKASFRQESITLSADQKLRAAALYQLADVKSKADEVVPKSDEFLDQLTRLQQGAGGQAPAPAVPDGKELEALRAAIGNERITRLLDQEAQWKQHIPAWKAAAKRIAERAPRWQQLEALLAHGNGLADLAAVRTAAEGIRSGRLLADEADHVQPQLKAAVQVLRTALTAAHNTFADAYAAQLEQLEASQPWKDIKPADRDRILADLGLRGPDPLKAASEEELLAALNAWPLTGWRDRTHALPARCSEALQRAAQLLEPKTRTIKLHSATLRTPEDVKTWLAEQENQLLKALKQGPIIIQ